MAGQFHFKLVSAPFQIDTGGNGLIDDRRIWPSGGLGYEYAEVDLEAEKPRITRFTPGVQYSAMLRTGTARSYRVKPDEIGLVMSSKNIKTPTQHDIYKLWQLGKPVAFTPWWDQHTMFCSTFGQVDVGAGITEIGKNEAGTLVPRLAGGDFYEGRFDKNDIGWLTRLLTGEKAKLQGGMIGNAILLERKSKNYAVADPTWTASGTAFVKDMDDGNNDMGHTKLFHSDASAGADIDTVVGAAPGPGPALPVSTEVTASVWAKGHGDLILSVTGKGSGTTVTLDPEKWQRVFHTFTTSADNHEIILTPDIGGGVGCLSSFSSLQVEEGDTPTSYMDPAITAPTAADKLQITGPLGRSADITVALWFRRSDVPTGSTKYFMSANDTADYWIRLGASNLLNANLCDSGLASSSIGAPTGAWEQLVVTRQFDVATERLQMKIFHDGVEVGTASYAAPLVSAKVSMFPNGMFIGSDLGLVSPGNLGADMPIDRFRVDGRAWSLQDIEDDYELLRHDGIRAFLATTAGRYFRFTNIPGSFRGGVDPDAMQGSIQLEQIGVNPAGVAQ